VFNEGYLDNLQSDFEQWLTDHVNDPSTNVVNVFGDIPSNYQVELSGHIKLDLSASISSSEDQIKSIIKTALLSRLTLGVDPLRVTLLSYTPDADEQGVEVELSVLPATETSGESQDSAAVIASAINALFISASEEPNLPGTTGENEGSSGSSEQQAQTTETTETTETTDSETNTDSNTPAPTDGNSETSNSDQPQAESSSSNPFGKGVSSTTPPKSAIVFPYAAFHGEATTTTDTPANSSASTLCVSYLFAVVLAILFLV